MDAKSSGFIAVLPKIWYSIVTFYTYIKNRIVGVVKNVSRRI